MITMTLKDLIQDYEKIRDMPEFTFINTKALIKVYIAFHYAELAGLLNEYRPHPVTFNLDGTVKRVLSREELLALTVDNLYECAKQEWFNTQKEEQENE